MQPQKTIATVMVETIATREDTDDAEKLTTWLFWTGVPATNSYRSGDHASCVIDALEDKQCTYLKKMAKISTLVLDGEVK